MMYPDRLLRGLSPHSIDAGIILPDAFKLDPVRDDGFCEISITWYDEPQSLETICSQRKDSGEIQFTEGIAEINRHELDERMHPHFISKYLDYERRPTPSNKYHGNLLVNDNLAKQLKTMIKSQLALLANSSIHPNPYSSMLLVPNSSETR